MIKNEKFGQKINFSKSGSGGSKLSKTVALLAVPLVLAE